MLYKILSVILKVTCFRVFFLWFWIYRFFQVTQGKISFIYRELQGISSKI